MGMAAYNYWDRFKLVEVGESAGLTATVSAYDNDVFKLTGVDLRLNNHNSRSSFVVKDDLYRDNEHDLCNLANIEVAGLTLTSAHNGHLFFKGVLIGASYWNPGDFDVLVREADKCDHHSCVGYDHYIGLPYVAPEHNLPITDVEIAIEVGS